MPLRPESADDERGADGDVVVAEDGVSAGRFESGEDLGTAVGGVAAGDEGERAAGDEVAGDEDEVGRERVDAVDDVLEEEGLGELVEMDVGELDDAEAVEWLGEIGDTDGGVDYVEFVARDLAGVESEACCGDAGAEKKFAAGEARGGRAALRNGHSSMIPGWEDTAMRHARCKA